MALVALASALAPSLRPSGQVDLGPLDLRLGSVTSAGFKVGYSDLHSIGVEMDEAVAARLFPCTVRPPFGSDRQACRSAPKWPLQLAFTLQESGLDISSAIDPSLAVAGGRYSGESYTWGAGYVDLHSGTKYQLSVRMLTNATALKSARPRLVLYDADPSFGDRQALGALAAYFVALVAALAAVVWSLVAFWRTTRLRPQR